MAEHAEQIEARLCAYVEGDLNALERAEIEQYLAANPEHRAVIDQLARHRLLLRSLPRENAPADLMENFQAQLEREVLLESEHGAARPSHFRMGWWPQVLQAAAIFVLAVGLALIVYSVLPPNHPAVSIVMQPEAPAEPEAQGELADAAPEAVAAVRSDARGGADAVGSVTPEIAVPTVGTGAEPLAFGAPRMAKGAEGEGAGAMGGRTEPKAQATIIAVTAEDVSRANDQVLQYLTSNGIAFSYVPSASVDAQQVALALEPETMSAGAQLQERMSARTMMAPAGSAGAASRGAAAEPAPLAVAEEAHLGGEARRQVRGRSAGYGAAARPSAAVERPLNSPATQAAVAQSEQLRAEVEAGQSLGRDAASALQTQGAEALQQAQTPQSAFTGRVVLARSVKRNQVSELVAALSAPAQGQRAQVVRGVAAIELGNELETSVGIRGGMQRQFAMKAVEREARSVEPEGTAPAAAIANAPAESEGMAVTQESQHGLAAERVADSPTTQPAQPPGPDALTRDEAADTLDLVIVLQSQAPAAAGLAAPATRPIAAPTTQPASPAPEPAQ